MVLANSGVGQLEGGLIRATREGYLEDASSRALSQGGFLDEAFFERLLGPHERKMSMPGPRSDPVHIVT